jgi:hypothetical protein
MFFSPHIRLFMQKSFSCLCFWHPLLFSNSVSKSPKHNSYGKQSIDCWKNILYAKTALFNNFPNPLLHIPSFS